MKRGTLAQAIPKDIALRLCEEIRRDNQGRWYRLAAMQCWGLHDVHRRRPREDVLQRQAWQPRL